MADGDLANGEPGRAAWDPVTRSYGQQLLRRLHRRLHLFSFVMTRPKEPEGDSLQIAFCVAEAGAGSALLARFGLRASYELQRPTEGPFRGATVQAYVARFPTDQYGHLRRDQTLAVVRLWNDDAIYDVTPALVDQAELIEKRLVAIGADAIPREQRLLSWVTADTNPEYFPS